MKFNFLFIEMQKDLKNIQNKLAVTIYKFFLAKYDDNKYAFAKVIC
jgi:hypothetical protein